MVRGSAGIYFVDHSHPVLYHNLLFTLTCPSPLSLHHCPSSPPLFPPFPPFWPFGLTSLRIKTPFTHLYDLETRTWAKPLAAGQPPARAAAASTTYNNKLLLHGGCPILRMTPVLHRDQLSFVCEGSLLSDLWSFDGSVWTNLAAEQSPTL